VIDERLLQSARRLEMVRDMAAHIAPAQRREVLLSLSKQNGERIRLYSPQGALQFDSARAGGATYTLVDPAEEPLKRQVARFLDEMVDSIVRSDPLEAFEEPRRDVANAWAEVRESARSGHAVATARFAPDRTPMISAAVHLQDGSTVLAITNARDITRAVRAERLRLALVVTMALLGSIWLSLFLARTIVLPLRRLARGTARGAPWPRTAGPYPPSPRPPRRDRRARAVGRRHDRGAAPPDRRDGQLCRRCEP
jgi:two-component system sensor histidine kinase ChvG